MKTKEKKSTGLPEPQDRRSQSAGNHKSDAPRDHSQAGRLRLKLFCCPTDWKTTHASVCLLRAMTGALRARILLWGGESDSEKSHRQQNGDSRIRHSIFSPLSAGSARFLMGRLYETQPILLSPILLSH
jgi:hypothetical protein